MRRDDEDEAVALLWDAGTAGIEVPEAGVLLAWFHASVDLEPRIAVALERLPGARVETAIVPDVDWVARFRDSFRAFDAGSFRIVPAWEGIPPAPRVLVVDPGRAFGTGTHETTRLCLSGLEALAAARPLGRVLDLGTGTGILALAALRLGASAALAIDDDPDAVASAAAHARLNNLPVTIVRGDGGRPLRPASFDVVVANVTARLLAERRDEIASLARPGARLLLSGLLEDDVGWLRPAYAGFGPVAVRTDGEWAALLVERP